MPRPGRCFGSAKTHSSEQLGVVCVELVAYIEAIYRICHFLLRMSGNYTWTDPWALWNTTRQTKWLRARTEGANGQTNRRTKGHKTAEEWTDEHNDRRSEGRMNGRSNASMGYTQKLNRRWRQIVWVNNNGGSSANFVKWPGRKPPSGRWWTWAARVSLMQHSRGPYDSYLITLTSIGGVYGVVIMNIICLAECLSIC